jgi:ribosome-associated toxin RatA of RatAB toxin-antitoxin module
MEDYTRDNVLEALSKLDLKSRRRANVDQRSYLFAVLAYKFNLSEHTISDITNVPRETINYNKKLTVQFHKDKVFIANVFVYAQRFPFDFSDIKVERVYRQKTVTLNLDHRQFKKLKTAGQILGHGSIRTTIKFFLEKSLKLWEE